MALFENFPYTNFHELNLDWIIKKMIELGKKVDDAISSKIKIADPLQWDISKQYEEFTIVMNDDIAYLSMQPVPAGVSISNTDYWQEIFNLDELFNNFKDSISFNDDGTSEISSVDRDVNSLVWRNDTLYKVIAQIEQGDYYTVNNTEPISIEEWLMPFIEKLLHIEDVQKAARQFILIGDSFGGGIDGDDNAHNVQGGGWIQRFKESVQGWATVYNSQVPLGGVYGFASSRPFLDVLQYIENSIPDKEKITDLVVLGGTNDIGIAEATIKNAIDTFVTYAHSHFPKARIAIGCLGTDIYNMIQMGKIYSHCATKGAEYIADLRGLFCLKQYIGADNVHLTRSGYEYYQQWISQAILTSKSYWRFAETSENIIVNIDPAFSTNHNVVRLSYTITPNTFKMALCGQYDDSQGIANVIPIDSSGNLDTRIAELPWIKVFAPNFKFQTILCNNGRIAELYVTLAGYINIIRPFGLSPAACFFTASQAAIYPY